MSLIYIFIDGFKGTDLFKQHPIYRRLLRIVMVIANLYVLTFMYAVLVRLFAGITYAEMWSLFVTKVTEPAFLISVLFVLTAMLLLNLIHEIILILGRSTLVGLILGKYISPKEQNKVFMFLNLQSSFKISEQLGHTQFCYFIKDCFSDLTESVLKYKGEIYQYVGSEVIICWDLRDGIHEGNCLKLFFDFENTLHNKSEHYKNKYDVIPSFVAGVSSGFVTVSEVGTVRRTISYLSDVLNTSARLSALCDEYKVGIAISDDVKQLMPSNLPFSYELLGNLQLRGKIRSLNIFNVRMNDGAKIKEGQHKFWDYTTSSRNIYPNIFSWVSICVIYVFYFFSVDDRHTDEIANFYNLIIIGIIAPIFTGIAYWLSSLMDDTKLLRNYSYVVSISLKVAMFYVMIILIIALNYPFSIHYHQITLGAFVLKIIMKDTFIAVTLMTIANISIIDSMRHLLLHSGGSKSLNILLGTYENPVDEYKIFMFLDLQSSTTIAENLGHSKFSALIQDCVRDVTDSILKYKAEVYKYVGDEIIMTWDVTNASENMNCIRLFFDFEKVLKSKQSFYMDKYNVLPKFKASIHVGDVTISEVGVIKKEIMYLSDVLSVAGKMEALCNKYNKSLIVSGDFIKIVPTDLPFEYHLLGNLQAFGQQKAIDIFSIEEKS